MLVNIFVHFLVRLVLCIPSKSYSIVVMCVGQHPPSEIREVIPYLLPGYSR